MGILDAILHLTNFILPALLVSLLVTLSGHFYKKKSALPPALSIKFAINLIACMVVLIIGLILTGRDGKMLTYLAMVLASGTTQWILGGGWRK